VVRCNAVVLHGPGKHQHRGDRVESASVTVTASNEGKSERKGSHEASLWCGVCVDYVFTNGTTSGQATCNR